MTEHGMLLETDATASLAGQVAIVTGAAKGLGLAITADLARQGADLVLAGRDLQALEAHANELDQRYDHRASLVARTDVVSEQAVANMVAETIRRFGRIDILVNAAGGTGPIETAAQDVSLEDFRSILDLNVLGTFLPCKHVIPHLIERGSGRIVNIAGTSALRGYRNRVGYSSSK
ncbi:MAG: SDR family NAD(P)-dependent oxidoreductase, partial [Acidimicrobiia bacterium]